MSQNPLANEVLIDARGAAEPIWEELWRHRELAYFLAVRDVRVKYKQSVIGIAWVVLQPLLAMTIFTFFFGRVARMPSDNIPYAAFSLAALVPWTFFSNAVNAGANSVVGNAGLVTKVYFPRVIIPVSAVCAAVVDLVVSTAMLLILTLLLRVPIQPTALLIPFFGVMALGCALGLSLWLAAFNVEFRDVKHAIPFLIQLGLFATPVLYSSSMVPDRWRTVYALNPMVGIVDGFRWSIFGTGSLDSVAVSCGLIVVLVASGVVVFQRAEARFADVI